MPPSRSYCSGRSAWPTVLYLVAFAVFLLILGRWWIAPGIQTLQDPAVDPRDKATIKAYAALLLIIVLTLSFVGLLLVFRLRRHFFPDHSLRHRTEYPDAWTESARRLKTTDRSIDFDDDEQG